MERAKKGKEHDDIFDQLKAAVVETAMNSHLWEDKVSLPTIYLLECTKRFSPKPVPVDDPTHPSPVLLTHCGKYMKTIIF